MKTENTATPPVEALVQWLSYSLQSSKFTENNPPPPPDIFVPYLSKILQDNFARTGSWELPPDPAFDVESRIEIPVQFPISPEYVPQLPVAPAKPVKELRDYKNTVYRKAALELASEASPREIQLLTVYLTWKHFLLFLDRDWLTLSVEFLAKELGWSKRDVIKAQTALQSRRLVRLGYAGIEFGVKREKILEVSDFDLYREDVSMLPKKLGGGHGGIFSPRSVQTGRLQVYGRKKIQDDQPVAIGSLIVKFGFSMPELPEFTPFGEEAEPSYQRYRHSRTKLNQVEPEAEPSRTKTAGTTLEVEPQTEPSRTILENSAFELNLSRTEDELSRTKPTEVHVHEHIKHKNLSINDHVHDKLPDFSPEQQAKYEFVREIFEPHITDVQMLERSCIKIALNQHSLELLHQIYEACLSARPSLKVENFWAFLNSRLQSGVSPKIVTSKNELKSSPSELKNKLKSNKIPSLNQQSLPVSSSEADIAEILTSSWGNFQREFVKLNNDSSVTLEGSHLISAVSDNGLITVRLKLRESWQTRLITAEIRQDIVSALRRVLARPVAVLIE